MDFSTLASRATMPKSHPPTDKVLHRWDLWRSETPDPEAVAEAEMCMYNNLPYLFDDKQWRITFIGEGNEDCFEIEGVEWV